MTDFSEDTLIEQPAIALLGTLGWTTANCFAETFGTTGTLGRANDSEVILTRPLKAALKKLNPNLPVTAIDLAIEELTQDRRALSPVAANREVYGLIKNGVEVEYHDPEKGEQVRERVRVIDWNNPANNDFFLASQFWIQGQIYRWRADLVGFVNGLPLVFIELKAAHKRLENAYQGNLRDYKDTVPQLFWCNALIILSNGSESRVGSMTAKWEYFAQWKKINSEGEKGIVSLETMLRGTCDPERLLDLVENFTLFHETKGGIIKLLAKNHQYLGVNNAIVAVREIRRNQGKLGVFWHTQGSGKSFSMVFFGQKVLRKLPGNWTFVVVTDREELDGQIYKNFANTGAVTEAEERVRADSGQHLRKLLQEDHRYVFTLIHKFNLTADEKKAGKTKYPMLSERSDVIVMTDEAHRSQYDVLALNMRSALPKAAFIGFTGTPLIKGEEERTREVFGDYVSVYNFKQSAEDKATVPLYYENRIPELQLTNKDLNRDMEKLLESAELDEDQEKKLEREFAREYHLITRDERLDKIAEDVVTHFVGRGYRGKGMFIAIDKMTAVRMYNKVQAAWAKRIAELKKKLAHTKETERDWLTNQIAYMESTDMAVVVSQAQNEVADFKEKGLDILPHRLRMMKDDLETKFKDPDDPFRLVFVCAMWITGFDVPSCSTIYLDKPMRNHTLMQTIARANRVFGDKVNGLIVDYVGVLRDLEKALAIYGGGEGTGGGGEGGGGGGPVQDKDELVELLQEAIDDATEYCRERSIDVARMLATSGFERVRLLDDAVDAILINDESKKRFISLASYVIRVYKAILPDNRASDFSAMVTLFAVIVEKINSLTPTADISEIMKDVEELLDWSIATEGYVIRAAKEGEKPQYLDLSKIDFEALRKHFAKSRKRMEIQRLRGAIESKLALMIALNPMRVDFQDKFQKLIDEYNAGSANVEQIYQQLMDFAQALNAEEQRHVKEQLTEEELAIFDLLTKPRVEVTKKEEAEIKTVAKQLLAKLKKEKLVLDWRLKQQAQAEVRLCIETVLDQLPRVYAKPLYLAKCDAVYQHVYANYLGAEQGTYATA